jgi:hypothetical protein
VAAWAGGAGGLAARAVASGGASGRAGERRYAILRPSIRGISRSMKLLAAALPLRWIFGSGEVSGKARWAMGCPDRHGLWAAFIYT